MMDWNERPQAAAKLAALCLERAAQKVWLRWTFGAVNSAGAEAGASSVFPSPSSGLSVSLLHEPTYSPHGPFRFHQPSCRKRLNLCTSSTVQTRIPLTRVGGFFMGL